MNDDSNYEKDYFYNNDIIINISVLNNNIN